MLAAGFLKVLEDAAFELIGVGQVVLTHEDRCLLAANAAGTKAHHGLVLQLSLVCQQSLRKIAEFAQAPVDGALEGALIDFEAVACIEQDNRPALVVHAGVQPEFELGR